ncbi:hypothetical protein ACGTNG_14505 [Halomonas sp. 1390]|uniref:hypothetical protein n=1 Tax=Halomonas sp. B23F22_3 TaxID=3459516 RepID=UPI00373F655C
MVSNNGDVLVEAEIVGISLLPTIISGPAIKAGALRVILARHAPEPMPLYSGECSPSAPGEQGALFRRLPR